MARDAGILSFSGTGVNRHVNPSTKAKPKALSGKLFSRILAEEVPDENDSLSHHGYVTKMSFILESFHVPHAYVKQEVNQASNDQ